MSDQPKQKPAAEIREGNVKIAIWERSGPKGRFYTAGKPELAYKDDDGKWHNDVSSYSEFDIVDLMIAAGKTKSALKRLRRAARQDIEPDSEAA